MTTACENLKENLQVTRAKPKLKSSVTVANLQLAIQEQILCAATQGAQITCMGGDSTVADHERGGWEAMASQGVSVSASASVHKTTHFDVLERRTRHSQMFPKYHGTACRRCSR